MLKKEIEMQEVVKDNIWLNVKEIFQNEFGIEIYNSWLSKLNFVSFNGFELVLAVETQFIKEWISREFLEGKKAKVNGEFVWIKKGLKQILLEKLNIKNVEIIVDKEVKSETINYINNITNLSQNNNIFAIGTELNSLYTFENFVVGESNKSAYSVAQSIINNEDLGFSVNPFFIHGNVGLGKTHLMQAMAWEFKNKHQDQNVVYLSAEKFMYLFVQALQNKTINEFKEQFRNIDVLFIDDLQFIAGKEGTQKEFFYTFNTLLDANKKIILACDKAPENMENIDNVLKSRMSGGVVVDILMPDYEMRYKLAEKKAQLLGLNCSNEIFEYIAQNVPSTNRDIEGIIKKLLIHQKFVNQNITIDVVKSIVKDLAISSNKTILIDNIQQKVADFYKITKSEILSDKRDRKFSLPRQIAFYLSKKLTKKSFPEIGKEFGNKNHATVIFACNKIENEIKTNFELADNINKIEKSLK